MSQLDDIQARITDCKTYNFGMRNADTLAHFDAPFLLALVREQQAKLDAVEQLADYWTRTPALRRVSAASRLLVALAGDEPTP